MKNLSNITGVIGIIIIFGAIFCIVVTNQFDLPYQIALFVGIAALFFFVVQNTNSIIKLFGSRFVKYSSFALVMTLLSVTVLALVNFIAFRHSVRYDATEHKQFSISQQTIQMLSLLKNDISVTAFLPSESPVKKQFKDLFSLYTAESNKIHVTYIDPYKDPLAAEQFKLTEDTVVMFKQGDQEKRITSFDEPSITSAIISITREKSKKLCFIDGHGEKTWDGVDANSISGAKSSIEKQGFQVESIKLYQTHDIPQVCDLALIVGPKQGLVEAEEKALTDWLEKGGHLIALIDPEADPYWADYMKKWGLLLRQDIIVDANAQAFVGNAAMPLGVSVGMHKITEALKNNPIVVPMARSMDKFETVPHEGNIEFLIRTVDENSWGESDVNILKPSETGEPKMPVFDGADVKGPLNIAALITFNADTSNQNASDQNKDTTKPPSEADSKKQAMIAVFGDSDFITNGYYDTTLNKDTFLNTVSFLTDEKDLISIRPKESSNKTLSMTQTQANFIFYFSVVFGPSIALGFGIVTYRRKVHK